MFSFSLIHGPWIRFSVPCPTILPRNRLIMSVDTSVSHGRSCVATITVVPHSFQADTAASLTSKALDSSTLAVGSSSMSTLGLSASLEARATRCTSPPESWYQGLSANFEGESPTRSRESWTLLLSSSVSPLSLNP